MNALKPVMGKKQTPALNSGLSEKIVEKSFVSQNICFKMQNFGNKNYHFK